MVHNNEYIYIYIFFFFCETIMNIFGVYEKRFQNRWHQIFSGSWTKGHTVIEYCDVNTFTFQHEFPRQFPRTYEASKDIVMWILFHVLYIYVTDNVASYSLWGQVPNQPTEKKSIESLIICFLFNSLLYWENKNSFWVLVGFCSYCSRTRIWF